MKRFKSVLSLALPLVMFFWGCNSTVYDIEEIEEVVVVSPDTQNSKPENVSEIKPDLKEDSKFNDKQVVSKSFAIQIGAFTDENNAETLMNRANKNLSEKLYIKNINGLYKVRVGNFDILSDAKQILDKLHDFGYSDAFIVELTFSQTQE